LLRQQLQSLKTRLNDQTLELDNEVLKSFDLRQQLHLLNEILAQKTSQINEQQRKIDNLIKIDIEQLKIDRQHVQQQLIELQLKYDHLTNQQQMYELKLLEQEEREMKLKLQVQQIRELHEQVLNEKQSGQTEKYKLEQFNIDLQQKQLEYEQNLRTKLEEIESVS